MPASTRTREETCLKRTKLRREEGEEEEEEEEKEAAVAQAAPPGMIGREDGIEVEPNEHSFMEPEEAIFIRRCGSL